MDMSKSLEEQLLNRQRLESLMIKNYPVVPPDSIIKTFSHLRPDEVDLIVSQDSSGLVAGSIVVRNSQWSKFLLETWMDPLYRSYNFQKAERHALVSNADHGDAKRDRRETNFKIRSTLCNGIPLFSQSWHSCRNARSAPTHAPTKATLTKMATLSSCSPAARNQATRAARLCRRAITRNGALQCKQKSGRKKEEGSSIHLYLGANAREANYGSKIHYETETRETKKYIKKTGNLSRVRRAGGRRRRQGIQKQLA